MSTADVAIVTFAGTLLAALLAAAIAHKIGWLHFGVMQEAHKLNVTKATSKVGCSVTVEQRQVLSDAYRPHLVLHLTIYSEGELASSDITGHWYLSAPPSGARFCPPRPIQIDILGKQPFRDEYCFQESANWPRNSISVSVDVVFDYTSHPNNQTIHYSVKYGYDRPSGTMVRC